MSASPRPSPGWRWVLTRVVPRAERDLLVAELDDAFARRVASAGRTGADRWYRQEVMAFVRRAPRQGARGVRREVGRWSGGGIREVAVVARGLWRTPGFTALAALTLALGIGASAVVFAIADRALLRPLPYPDADQLVSVLDGWGTSLASIEILDRDLTTVSAIGGAWDASGMTLEPDAGPARRVTAARVSPEYLEALAVLPSEGRLFRPEESEPGRNGVVLLSADFFRAEFGGDVAALGRTLYLDGERYVVVGVLPDGFDMPSARNDVWIPAVVDTSPAAVGLYWGMGTYRIVARMTPGTTPSQVKDEVLLAQETVRMANPLWTPVPGFWEAGVVTTLRAARGGDARTPLLLLLSAVGVVLLVVCSNVANLLLSRGLSRRRDRAVRTALGASRAQLAGRQMTESVLLALVGSLGGVLLAGVGLEALRPLLPSGVPGAARVELDLRVLGFAMLVAFLVSVVAGLIPALRSARRSPGAFLQEAGRGGMSGRAARRTTHVLVGAQMAAAVVLVTGAGLLGRSLREMTRVDPGFDAEGRVTMRIDVPPGIEEDRAARAEYLSRAEAAFEAEPLLDGVALASSIPFGSERENMAVFIEGVTDDPNDLPMAQQRRVSSDFFDVAGIPLLAGRAFSDSDAIDAPLVAIVDEVFVRRLLGGAEPVGMVIRYPWRGAPDIRVVGVVGGTGDGDLTAEAEPTIWMPIRQLAGGTIGHAVVVARTGESAGPALAALLDRARSFDNRMAVSEVAEYPDLLRDSLAAPRLLALLLILFAGSTLTLGCVGVYGVAAFAARDRVREIGVRMTLGADPTEIRADVLKLGIALALPGGAVGLLLAALGGRVLSSFLYGISPIDPITFIGTPVLLLAAALAAVYVPARRATQVDPAIVLRAE